jgi:hypothetical protein
MPFDRQKSDFRPRFIAFTGSDFHSEPETGISLADQVAKSAVDLPVYYAERLIGTSLRENGVNGSLYLTRDSDGEVARSPDFFA